MSSRSKRKREAKERDPSTRSAEPGSPEGSERKSKREPAIFTVIGLVIFFVGGVFVGIQFFDSWRIGFICGGAAVVGAGVLVWKGESLLDALSGL